MHVRAEGPTGVFAEESTWRAGVNLLNRADWMRDQPAVEDVPHSDDLRCGREIDPEPAAQPRRCQLRGPREGRHFEWAGDGRKHGGGGPRQILRIRYPRIRTETAPP